MNNPYCASYESLRSLLLIRQRKLLADRLRHWLTVFSYEEIEEQVSKGLGKVVDESMALSQADAKKSETTELLSALQLADFYFPNKDKKVCFDLRQKVNPALIQDCDDLMNAFEDHTHIDFIVRATKKELSFQLKRYRLDHDHKIFIAWLKEKVIRHYGDMSGTRLVILLQSYNGTSKVLAVDKLYEMFVQEVRQSVTFDEIFLMYNDAVSGYVVLHQLFPLHKRKLIPTDWMLRRFRGEC